MRALWEFFRIEDAIPIVLLIVLLNAVGSQASGPKETLWSRRIGLVGFLLFAITGISEYRPQTPTDYVLIVVGSMAFGALVIGLAMILLPVAVFVFRGLVVLWEFKPKVEPEPVEEIKVEPPPPPPPPPPLPPPPTNEARAKAAKEKYEEQLKLIEQSAMDPTERKAAEDKLKQKYLKRIDELL